jgi:hypothetical protein
MHIRAVPIAGATRAHGVMRLALTIGPVTTLRRMERTEQRTRDEPQADHGRDEAAPD